MGKGGYEEINQEICSQIFTTVMLQKFAWRNKDVMMFAYQILILWNQMNQNKVMLRKFAWKI